MSAGKGKTAKDSSGGDDAQCTATLNDLHGMWAQGITMDSSGCFDEDKLRKGAKDVVDVINCFDANLDKGTCPRKSQFASALTDEFCSPQQIIRHGSAVSKGAAAALIAIVVLLIIGLIAALIGLARKGKGAAGQPTGDAAGSASDANTMATGDIDPAN